MVLLVIMKEPLSAIKYRKKQNKFNKTNISVFYLQEKNTKTPSRYQKMSQCTQSKFS